ncbi:MAG: hypothetical protein HDS78_01185 [Bacteroidales bacterium]|nr:hypothetical protein [Bacteroidales bacterium]
MGLEGTHLNLDYIASANSCFAVDAFTEIFAYQEFCPYLSDITNLMPRVMRRFCLCALILVSLSLYGQRNYYTKKADKEAIKSAYRILKAFYPDKQLCVLDSVYDLDWFWLKGKVDTKTADKLEAYRIDKEFKYEEPRYEKGLATLLNADTCTSHNKGFYADFSRPYEQMIRCDIMPKDRRIGIIGSPTIEIFLFRYDDDGEIIQVTRNTLQVE